jgi:hypothetical protein
VAKKRLTPKQMVLRKYPHARCVDHRAYCKYWQVWAGVAPLGNPAYAPQDAWSNATVVLPRRRSRP